METRKLINYEKITLVIGLLASLAAGYFYNNGRLLLLYLIVVPIFVSSLILKGRIKYLFWVVLLLSPIYSAAMLDPFNGSGYPISVLIMPVLLMAVLYQWVAKKKIELSLVDYYLLAFVIVYIVSAIVNGGTIESEQLVAGSVILLTIGTFYFYAQTHINKLITSPVDLWYKLSVILWPMATLVILYLVVNQVRIGFQFKTYQEGETIHGSIGAGILSAVCLFSYANYLHETHNIKKVVSLIYLFACSAGLIITWSRTWYIATLAGVLLLMFVYGKKRLARAVLIVIIVLGSVVFFSRYQNVLFSEGRFEDTTRYGIWDNGIQVISKKPLLGVGIGNFPKYSIFYYWGGEKKASSLHNTYLQQAVDGGMPMALCLIGILAASFYTGLKLFRNKNQIMRAYGTFLMAVIAAHFIAGLTAEEIIPSFNNRKYLGLTSAIYFWSILGIGQGLLTKDKNNISVNKSE